MNKRNRYLIKDEERGHRPKLSPDEDTVRVTLQFPESLWKAIKEKSQGKHQKWIRDVLTKTIHKGGAMRSILFMFALSFSLFAGERYETFMASLTKGDSTRYADTNFFQDNARFIVAANLYDRGLGNIQGSLEQAGKLYILLNKDTVSIDSFQKSFFEKDSVLLKEYTKESLKLIESYHNWVLTSLYLKNNCEKSSVYMRRVWGMASNLGVIEEYSILRPTLQKFMQDACAECRKNPTSCK